MKKVIFIGANTKATDMQIISSMKVGESLASNDYYCIHGGGEGTMLSVTRGIKHVDSEGKCCHIITPENMIPTNVDTYDVIGKKDIVHNIHVRIGMLLELSKQVKYIIVYGGGIGTIHELLSVMVHWYNDPDNMPQILICDEDATEWCSQLSNLLSPLCVPERPYMDIMRKKIFKLSTTDLIKVLQEVKKLDDKETLLF